MMKAIDFLKLDERTINKLAKNYGLEYSRLNGDTVSSKANALFYYLKSANLLEKAEAIVNKSVVGISYCSQNSDIVYPVVELLKEKQYEVFIDRDNIHETGWLIETFERQLARQKNLLLFISSGYLKSFHCMYELYNCYCYNRSDRNEFYKHIIPIAVDKTIFNSKCINRLQRYWQKQVEDKRRETYEMKGIRMGLLHEEFDKYEAICCEFTNILLMVKNMSMIVMEIEQGIDPVAKSIIQRIELREAKS